MLVKSHEAWLFIHSIDDPVDQKIMMGLFTSAIRRIHSTEDNVYHPASFDMLFYIETAYFFINKRKLLLEILSGNLDIDDIPNDF